MVWMEVNETAQLYNKNVFNQVVIAHDDMAQNILERIVG